MSFYTILYHSYTEREPHHALWDCVHVYVCVCAFKHEEIKRKRKADMQVMLMYADASRRRLRGNERQTCKSSSKELSLLDPVCAQVDVEKNAITLDTL